MRAPRSYSTARPARIQNSRSAIGFDWLGRRQRAPDIQYEITNQHDWGVVNEARLRVVSRRRRIDELERTTVRHDKRLSWKQGSGLTKEKSKSRGYSVEMELRNVEMESWC